MSVIPYGVGSANVLPPVPVTSPPDDVDVWPPKQAARSSVNDNRQAVGVMFFIFILRFP